VDRSGVIRYAHHASSMSDIPTSKTLLDVLYQLNRVVAESLPAEKA
jgi:hypothetical protein